MTVFRASDSQKDSQKFNPKNKKKPGQRLLEIDSEVSGNRDTQVAGFRIQTYEIYDKKLLARIEFTRSIFYSAQLR